MGRTGDTVVVGNRWSLSIEFESAAFRSWRRVVLTVKIIDSDLRGLVLVDVMILRCDTLMVVRHSVEDLKLSVHADITWIPTQRVVART
jgi:hypothetical protein